MSRLILLDPADPGPAWAPFTGARPIAELRAGAWRIRERWAGVLGAERVEVMAAHCPGFTDADAAPCIPEGTVPGPAVIARSDFAPAGIPVELDEETRRLVHDGVTVAWLVAEGESWAGPHEEGAGLPIEGLLLRGSYDLLTALEHFLPADCAESATQGSDPVPDGSILLGDPADLVLAGAQVEPGVVFDLRAGVVVLEEGVQVRSGTRLEGPLFACPDALLLGGAIRHSVIGPACRVHGEVSTSVFLGFANKSHDGFVGHSVIGQWVNLGAGTITSNLKNTYGEVRLDLPGGRLETGRTNVGSLVGDHAKTAIGTLLSTGTVIGAGASVVGAPVPRWVPPFAWEADGTARQGLEEFLTVARRVLPRRKVEVSPAIEASLRAIHGRLAR